MFFSCYNMNLSLSQQWSFKGCGQGDGIACRTYGVEAHKKLGLPSVTTQIMGDLIEGLCTIFDLTSTEIALEGSMRAYQVSCLNFKDEDTQDLCGSIFRIPIMSATRYTRFQKMKACDPISADMERTAFLKQARCYACRPRYMKTDFTDIPSMEYMNIHTCIDY